MKRRPILAVAFCTTLTLLFSGIRHGRAAELAMGVRVGEVTQHSAVVWTRITRDPARNPGYRDPQKQEPRRADYVPSEVAVEDREGETPGAPGQLQVRYSTREDLSMPRESAWAQAVAFRDFTHQFRLDQLTPATTYYVEVLARDGPNSPVTARTRGSFRTPPAVDQWQDLRFAVSTCQSYWDLDHAEGFQIYPGMAKQQIAFHVPAGDNVYLDSESPRARTIALARHHWHRMYSLPRLVEFYRHIPGYWIVDDHDTLCDDCFRGKTYEWMLPLTFEEGAAIYREQVPIGDSNYRTIRWGQGLQIWLVEGRLFRSPNSVPDGPEKTIWGHEQRAWLQESILASDAAFRVLISPTPIVGPDRENKADNHANETFAYEGNLFRNWTKEQNLTNFYVCCGDRHWQYYANSPAGRPATSTPVDRRAGTGTSSPFTA
jgi:alkaline phosphatase D